MVFVNIGANICMNSPNTTPMKRSVTRRLQKCYSAMSKPNTQRASIKEKLKVSLSVEWRDDEGGLPEGERWLEADRRGRWW
jgi:hypothetical protein